MKHLLKDRSPKLVRAKCLAEVKLADTTVWWTDVDCPECLIAMGHRVRRVRYIKREPVT